MGQQVYFRKLPPSFSGQSENVLDLTYVPAGVYVCRVMSETGSLVSDREFIIQ
jgi:hypothetical protein